MADRWGFKERWTTGFTWTLRSGTDQWLGSIDGALNEDGSTSFLARSESPSGAKSYRETFDDLVSAKTWVEEKARRIKRND